MARWPTGPFETRRTGFYGAIRQTPADGGCGVHGHPCVHYGVDLFAGYSPEQRTVVAPEGGIVTDVANGTSPPWSGYGPGIVLMRGGSGVFHLLSHLVFSTIKVKPGERVTEGTPLGLYDPGYGHSHYEVRRERTGPSKTNTIDPNVWLAEQAKRSRGSWAAAAAVLLGGAYLIYRFVLRRPAAAPPRLTP